MTEMTIQGHTLDRGSPVVFEKIATLPFTDSHVRQASAETAKSFRTQPVAVGAAPGQSDLTAIVGHGDETENRGVASSSSRSIGLTVGNDSQNAGLYDGSLSAVANSDAVHKRYSAYSGNSAESVINKRHTGGTSLEDYDSIDVNQVDRYGFFPQAVQRRVSSSSLDAARLRAKSLRRRSMLNRDTLKRASMNLGLYRHIDYLEPPKGDVVNIQKEVQRSQKWMIMAHRKDSAAPFEFKLTSKLVNRVYKGIPDCWRAPAWRSFLYTSPQPLHESVSDAEILHRYSLHADTMCESDEQIDLDVPRTISGHVLFRRRHQGGQRLLFRVLHAITLEYPQTGYVQGMASVAATLLCYFTEDQAFIMMARLWSERGLIDLYEPGFLKLLEAFERLEKRLRMSDVGRHLLNIGCEPMSWATRWYLTIFHVSLPFHTQLRVWDVFMLHSPDRVQGGVRFDVLEATTLALIEGMASVLLGSDFDQAMRILTMPLDVQDDDRLLRAIRKKLRT